MSYYFQSFWINIKLSIIWCTCCLKSWICNRNNSSPVISRKCERNCWKSICSRMFLPVLDYCIFKVFDCSYSWLLLFNYYSVLNHKTAINIQSCVIVCCNSQTVNMWILWTPSESFKVFAICFFDIRTVLFN